MSLLTVSALRASYGPVEVLRGIDFSVEAGEVVVILGANGSGKTTTLRALSGMVEATGSIEFSGDSILGRRPDQIARLGIAHVPQGRGTITDLTVEENLRLGAFTRKDREVIADMDRWYEVFPRLRDRRHQQAGGMSGGEQQMLAIARAMMARPELVLLDEPSLGLAPIITQGLFKTLSAINRDENVSILIVEQNATLALAIAQRGYVLETGEIVAAGSANELSNNDDVRRAYLGI